MTFETGTASASAFAVLVGDALRVVGEAVAACLATVPELEVVGVATTSEELLDAVASRKPALVLLDAALARTCRTSLVTAVLATNPDSRLLMTGIVAASDEVADALRDGVMGWLPTTSTAEAMVEAVHGVLRGEYRIPSELLANALKTFTRRPDESGGVRGGAARARTDSRLAALGDRELAVLACLVGGMERRDIAKRLGIADNTVRTHIGRILTKLDAHSMLEAAAIGRKAGLVGIADTR